MQSLKQLIQSKSPVDKNKFIVSDICKFKNIRTEISDYCFYFQREGSKKHSKFYPVNKQNHFLIEADHKRNYLFKGQLIKMPQSTLYYNIFDIIYNEQDQNGFVSFKKIVDELVKRNIWQDVNKKRNADIINNIHLKNQGFFKYAKINGNRVENKIDDGRELVEVVRGKGVKLNNPII